MITDYCLNDRFECMVSRSMWFAITFDILIHLVSDYQVKEHQECEIW